MGKNQSASGLTNIIQYDNNGNVSFVSGSTTLMQISSSGAITTTGVISGSNALSASYALNSGLLNETGSVGFATTGSLLTVSSSQQQISASLLQVSASLLTLTASFNAVSASQQQISSSQQQISASLLNVIAIGATTGSNSFRATQSITGSLTVTGQIIAQTLNVQQVTSSIIYSSGSNNFGCDLNSRQTFTGSVNITGSQTVFGNVLINYPSSTTTGNAFPRLGVSNTNATQQDYNISELYVSAGNGAVAGGLVASYSSTYPTSTPSVMLRNNGNGPLYLSANGSVIMTISGSGYVGIGTNCPTGYLNISTATPGQNEPHIRLTDSSAAGNGGNVYISADKTGVGYNNLTMLAFSYTFKGGASATNYLTINTSGVSCFAGAVCASSFLSSAQSSLNGLVVSCNVNSNCFTGITVVNSAGAGSDASRSGIAFQAYDWVQSAIWHGRNTAAAFVGALVFGTNPNTSNLGVGGVCTRLTITNDGTSTFACDLCSKTLTTFGGGLNENYSSTGGGHVNRYFAAKYIPENTTSAFFKITTSGASSTHIQLAGSNSGVGWHSGQIYLASNSAYWGGFIGSGTSVSTAGTAAGYISGMFSDGAGGQIYCVTVANNGTGTSSLIWAYITTITYAGYSTSFTQL